MINLKKILAFLCLGVLIPTPARPQDAGRETRVAGAPANLLSRATAYLGTPYRWGGTTPVGFDCSGFVHFVFGVFGIDLARTSASQAHQGKPVGRDDLRQGDLLFFQTGRRRRGISHVGIYLGDGRFIHASSWGRPWERVVKISELAGTYYADHLVSARRIPLPAFAEAATLQ